MVAPTSLALVLDAFPSEKRATGVGIWGAAAAAAAATGPTLGGALVELSDWRLVFLVNLPLGAAVVLAGRRALHERPRLDSRLPDLPGALMLAASLALVTLAIVEGNDWGWTAPATLACFAASAALLGGVVGRSRTHPRPIVEPALFAHRSFRLGNLGTLLFAAAFFSLILGNVLFLTGVWGYTVLQAGAATLPGPAMSTVVSGPAGRLGLAFPTLGSAAVRDVPDDRFATASAVNAAFRQVGAVLGTAILVAIVAEPATLASALHVSDSAYLFSVFAALVAGGAALGLSPSGNREGRLVADGEMGMSRTVPAGSESGS
jgi:hypothetical protein